jgi:hypothetical protein
VVKKCLCHRITSVTDPKDNSTEKDLLERILRQRAKRLGVTEADVLAQSTLEKSSLRTIEKRSEESGLSPIEVLEQELNTDDDNPYPGPDCLLPHEFVQFLETGALPEDRAKHLNSCDPCGALVVAMRPSHEQAKEFKRALELREKVAFEATR